MSRTKNPTGQTSKRKKDGRQAKTRLGRADWIAGALRAMVAKGISAVTIDVVAAELEVTRGSFYHHFVDREDLLRAMLEYWLDRWTTQIREASRNRELDGTDALTNLSDLIRQREAAHLDAFVRSWAARDQMAFEYVKKADIIRIDYIRSLFEDLGFKGRELEVRSRLFYFYEAFEPMMATEPKVGKKDALAKEMLKLLSNR